MIERTRTILSRLTAAGMATGAVAAAAIAAVAPAAADECGSPPAYTADRSVQSPGKLTQAKVLSNGKFERENESASRFTIIELATAKRWLVDLNAKTIVEFPPRPEGGPPKALTENGYVDKTDLPGGEVQIERGFKQGDKKVMVSRTSCRPDAIFSKRILMVPAPNKTVFPLTVTQSNIVVGPVSDETFAIPTGLKTISAPPPPPPPKPKS